MNKFEGLTLPFTQHGWLRQFKSGVFRNGASWRNVEKVKVIGRGTMGSKLEEVHVIASWDVDQGGNKTLNVRKGQHYLSLKKGADELAFAIHSKDMWRILTYDCTYFRDVKTQREAEKILAATRWRKWNNKEGGGKR